MPHCMDKAKVSSFVALEPADCRNQVPFCCALPPVLYLAQGSLHAWVLTVLSDGKFAVLDSQEGDTHASLTSEE